MRLDEIIWDVSEKDPFWPKKARITEACQRVLVECAGKLYDAKTEIALYSGEDSMASRESAFVTLKAFEVLNGMIRAIEADSSAESAYDWAAEYAVISGVGYWRIVTDYESDDSFDQCIKIERIRAIRNVG